MNIEIMLSAMNLHKQDLNKMNINCKCTVINQCENMGFEKYKNFYIYSYKEIGNSNSRNRGLEHIKEDIILLCDDDVIYNKGFEEKVLKEFEDNPKADVIVFNMHNPNRNKRINYKRKKLHIYNSLNYASYNIAFRRKSVLNKNIRFNTDFGPNARYNNGTDTMFIVDMFKNNLVFYASPTFLGTVYNTKSTWFQGYNEKYFFNKGALFTAISKKFRYALCLQYLIRHRDVLKEMSFSKAYKKMIEGSEDYINSILKQGKYKTRIDYDFNNY
ncbi:MAG: glycosyltransferase family 2 protein [Clostridia bacterium]|nr:glycosyltransferase family 2 protein [Clostridia bacterium]